MMLSHPLNQIICGNCFDIMKQFLDNSVDTVITSPPYWALRNYGVEGQLGLEDHPQEYIDRLVEFGKIVHNILKPTGTFWLNLGDVYATKCLKKDNWLQPKQLLLIPSRVAIGLQNDGWILRSDVIWFKPNHLPDPTNDRLTRSYEHFFMFSKQRDYYFDLDSIREPPEDDKIYTTYEKEIQRRTDGKPDSRQYSSSEDGGFVHTEITFGNNPKGKNPGDVWSVPTSHFSGSHTAVFPEKLIEKIINCSSPKNGIVLDPFVGSGTTCIVASNLSRKFIGIDLNPEYVEMSKNRLMEAGFREEGDLFGWFG